MSTSRRRIAGRPRRRPPTAAGLRVPAPVPRWRRRHRRPAAGRDARPPRNWSQTLTSLIALGALVFTGVSVAQTGRQNTQQDSLATQGQITDRYTAAVNQIGSTIPDVRLGGIYALERIMRDSPADQPTIVEVLSAFVRDHPPGALTPVPPTPSTPALHLPADIAAALTVLSRRDTAHDGASVVDLSRTNFAEMDLEGIVPVRVNLTNANLTDAFLPDANLTSANLSGAHLAGANLTRANLFDANLSHALLTPAIVSRANLNLFTANLITENPTPTNLTGANLFFVDLTGADLSDADLTGANLSGADLFLVDLTGAELSGADLTSANVTSANLTSADARDTPLCNGAIPWLNLGYRCDGP